MGETYDFRDGRGPVPARRHPTGGGWVADTAWVDASVYAGADAVVSGGAWNESPPYAQIGRWVACMPTRTAILIGCQEAPVAAWTPARIAELAKQHSATPLEIAGATSFVLWCRAVAAAEVAE